MNGKIINSISTVRTALQNKKYFGTYHEAPTYTLTRDYFDNMCGVTPVSPPPIKFLSIEDLRACTQQQSYLCMYTTVAGKPKLLLATEEQELGHLTRFMKADGNPIFVPNHSISHRDLAGGTHPYFAGSVRTIGDRVIRSVVPDEIPAQFRRGAIANEIRFPGGISNASPYDTAGPHIRGLMEKALEDFGLQNVRGSFREYYPANRGYSAANVTRPEFLTTPPISPHQLAFSAITGRVSISSAPTSELSEQSYQALFAHASDSVPTTEPLHAAYATAAQEQHVSAEHFQKQMAAADRVAQTQKSMLDQTQLYNQINVPLPSKPLSINPSDTTEVVCAKIDAYFEDIIRDYLPQTKKLLHEMYYDNKNVTTTEYLMGDLGHCYPKKHKDDVILVKINAEFSHCPITSRMIKIHEIGVHAGQMHQRISQVGFDAFTREYSQFAKFTEQSVGLAEKIMLDSLPAEILHHDLKGSELKYKFYDDQERTLDDYVHLQHRNRVDFYYENFDKLTPEDHEAFLCNKQVSEFLKSNVQQFNPDGSGKMRSTAPYMVGSTAPYRNALEETIRSFQKLPTPVYDTKPTAEQPARAPDVREFVTHVENVAKAAARHPETTSTGSKPRSFSAASRVSFERLASTSATTNPVPLKPENYGPQLERSFKASRPNATQQPQRTSAEDIYMQAVHAASVPAASSAPAKKSAPTQPAQSATDAYEKAFEATTQSFREMPTPQYAASATATPPQPSKPPISAAQKAAQEDIARTNAEATKLISKGRESLKHVSTLLAHPKPNDWQYAAGLSQGIGTAANFLSMGANLCGSKKAASAFSAAASGGMMAAGGFAAAAASGMALIPGLNIVGGIGMAICGVMSAIFDDSDEVAAAQAAQHAEEMRALHAQIQEQATRVINVICSQIEVATHYLADKMDSHHQESMRAHSLTINALAQIYSLQYKNHVELKAKLERLGFLTIEKFGHIQTALHTIQKNYIQGMENNFRQEYGQLQEFHYLQTTLDRRLVNAVRIALNQKNLKEFERFAKELHQAIIAESFGSDSMTGRDVDLRSDDELIKVRIIQPFYSSRNIKQVAAGNIDALLRYTARVARVDAGYHSYDVPVFTMPNLILLIDRAWIFLELFRAQLPENNFKLSPEAHRNFSDVIAFLIEKQKQLAAVDLKKLFFVLKYYNNDSLLSLRIDILRIMQDTHNPSALIDHHKKRLNELEKKINPMLVFDPRKIIYPQCNIDFLRTTHQYSKIKIQQGSSDRWTTRSSYDDLAAIKEYLIAQYPHLYWRNHRCDPAVVYEYRGDDALGHQINVENDIFLHIGHAPEQTPKHAVSHYWESHEKIDKEFSTFHKSLQKGKCEVLKTRIFEPLTPSSGSINLGTWGRWEDKIFSKIPDEAAELENKGYGEIKLTYDSTMSPDTLCLILKGVFEPYDPEFPIVELFEKKYRTPIIASLYPDKDVALYNLWLTGYVYAVNKTPGAPMKFYNSTLSLPGFTSLPQLYFEADWTESLLPFFSSGTVIGPNPPFLDASDNPKIDLIKKQLDALQKGIDTKEQKQKEQNLKALNFSHVEKFLALIRLFSEIWAPASQPLSAPRLSQILEAQGVDGLLKIIDDLMEAVKDFQPKGTADELPFLIGQMQILFDQAKIVEREVLRQEAQPQRAAESDDDGYVTADGEDELLRAEIKDCGLDDARIEKTDRHAIRLIPVSNFQTPLAQATFFKKLKREKTGIGYKKVDGQDVIEVPLERKPR